MPSRSPASSRRTRWCPRAARSPMRSSPSGGPAAGLRPPEARWPRPSASGRVPRPRTAHPGRLRELPQARGPRGRAGRRAREGELVRELLPAVDNLERALLRGQGGRGALASGRQPRARRACTGCSSATGPRRSTRRASGSTRTCTRRSPRAPGRRRAGRGARRGREGLPAGRHGHPPGPRGGLGLAWRGHGSIQGARRGPQGVRGRHQEGLPQARPRYHPDKNPGDSQGRGAVQGHPGGLLDPLRPGEAQAVRRGRRAVRRGGGPGPFRPGGGRRPGFGGISDILSDLFGGAGAVAAAAARAGPRARARPRDGGVVSLRPGDRRRPGAGRRAAGRAVHHVPGTGAARARRPRSARAARGGAWSPRGRACSRSPSPAPSAAARAPRSRTRAPPASGAGSLRQVKRYRVNMPAGVRDGSRVRLARQGRARAGAAARQATST